MPSGEDYRALAADMLARARRESRLSEAQAEFQNLAQLYLRLADQADLNSHNDVVYETPIPHPQQQPQQQQQAQKQRKIDE